MKRAIIYFLSVLIILSIQANAQTVKLKIIESTDEHGAIFPYDFTEQKEINNSLANVYTYVKQERAKKDQEVILLNGGDIIQGTPAVYYYNFEKPNASHLHADVLNYMKYDAAVVGNHDIETGHPVYDRFNAQLNFPWLAANAINVKTGEPYFKPYTVLNRSGVKIAILGLITPHIPFWLPENIWSGIGWEDMVKSAKKWVEIIKKTEKPDLLIGLFHSGIDYTYGNQTAEQDKNENASKLVAQRVPGFDIIFVGHDHRGWNYKEKNLLGEEVQILGGTNGGRDVAVANCVLNFDNVKKEWKKEITGEIVLAKNFLPDKDFLKEFKPQFEEVKKYVSRTIGTFADELSSRPALFEDNAFSDFVHDLQLSITGAQISFTAPLTLNAKVNKGEVNVGTLFKLYRYENLLYTMKLTGKEIKDYLEFSYGLWFNTMKDADDHLLLFDFDNDGKIKYDTRNRAPRLKEQFYNFDCAAGINYIVDVSKPIGTRITILSMSDGSNFDMDKTYTAAINSYRGNGGGKHLIEGAGIPKEELNKRIVTSTDKDLRYYAIKWIENMKVFTPKTTENWKVIPEEWHLKGKTKDYKIMFVN
ncbi:MAG: 2' 3'-cyclic-nucleotide 2'-phosphodiesterase [Ignavibacteria bacterium]|nr:MAG: 2' 3'-cyclic-nucleotide 2'-phosphodiesterase [Ignavibacteria bacterium]KAF0156138.1 MAG: 2' 3'-cyclic-nucleotide 2'-phosphodiesterase [Ignavibacteria bacterium]